MLIQSIYVLKAVFDIQNDVNNINLGPSRDSQYSKIFKEKVADPRNPTVIDQTLQLLLTTFYPNLKALESEESQRNEALNLSKQVTVSLCILGSIQGLFYLSSGIQDEPQIQHGDHNAVWLQTAVITILIYLLLVCSDVI